MGVELTEGMILGVVLASGREPARRSNKTLTELDAVGQSSVQKLTLVRDP